MRIVQLSSQRAFYGGEVHLRDLAVELKARGHAVQAVVRPDSELARALPLAGVDVVTVPLIDWFEPRGMTALCRTLKRLRPDILHTHGPRDYYVGALATLGTGIGNVGTRHRLEPIAMARLKWPLLRRLSAMIAVSHAVADGLLTWGWPADRLVTVPNGIAEPTAPVPAAALRAQLDLPEAGPVIGYIGRLCPSKGLVCLLRAVASIRGRFPGLQLAIVGGDARSGAYRAELEALVAGVGLGSVVRFCGYRRDAARLTGAFDVQVVPSWAEPFGLVTLEALAAGVPVIATVSGGSREIIRDGCEGLLVPPQDVPALARALRQVLADACLRQQLAEAGRRRVADRFTLGRQVEATEQVYQLVRLGRRPVGRVRSRLVVPDRSR